MKELSLVKPKKPLLEPPKKFSILRLSPVSSTVIVKSLPAVKQNRKIAVEVKSFGGKSQITEFYGALGQYLTYQQGLKIAEPDRILYLAIPKIAKEEVFSLALTQQLISELAIKLLIYSTKGEIISWEQKN